MVTALWRRRFRAAMESSPDDAQRRWIPAAVKAASSSSSSYRGQHDRPRVLCGFVRMTMAQILVVDDDGGCRSFHRWTDLSTDEVTKTRVASGEEAFANLRRHVRPLITD